MSKSGKIFDVAVPVIILACATVYYLYNTYPGLQPFFELHFVASREAVGNWRLWTLVTHMFLHKEFLHLFIATTCLITFGIMLENLVGSKFFIEYFVVAGVVGGVNHCMISPMIHRPDATLFGATAPLTGVMVMAALIYRNQTIKLLRVFPIKAVYVAGFFVFVDMIGLFVPGSPIGNGAHIGTAFMAIVYYHKILRHRVWRNLRAAGEKQEMSYVKVTRLGWILPCKDDDSFEDMAAFLRDVMGLEISDQGVPTIDQQIKRFVKFKTPNGSLKLVEPDRLIKGELYTNPMLSLTVENLASAVKNLDTRKVKMIAPVFHQTETWAIVYFEAPDGRTYQIQGPYTNA